MISAHLLTATLLVTTLPALAQDKSATSPDSKQTTDLQKIGQSIAKEPWNLFANGNRPIVLDSRIGHLVDSDRQLMDDTLCFTMRSYVVARDSKDSDSVHPAGYSTCLPASRYRLRTTEIRTLTPDR